jgi:hypothetical protein
VRSLIMTKVATANINNFFDRLFSHLMLFSKSGRPVI